MAPEIHPTAIVEPSVLLGEGVRIGPFCVLRGPSEVGAGTILMERVSMGPHVKMGEHNRVHMGAVIGHEPQDHSFGGGPSGTVIGDRNEIREYVTIHRGTKEGTDTVIGDGTLLMAGSHVAHNCRVGDRVILANGVLLAGHVTVGEGAFLSGLVLVHQFVRIGRLALLRGGSRTSRDVPPFAMMDGTHTLRTINRVGLKRAGFSRELIREIALFYREMLLSGPLDRERLLAARTRSGPEVLEILDFVMASRRGICRSRNARSMDSEAPEQEE